MAKAVLIMDMPAACLTCKGLRKLKGGFLVPDKWYCRFDCMVREIDDNSPYMKFGHPDWCPLIELPDRINVSPENTEVYMNIYADGWNACIDALEGKENE